MSDTSGRYDPSLHSPEGMEMLDRMDEIADRIEEELGLTNIDVLAEYRSWLDDNYKQDEIVRGGGWPTELIMDSDTVDRFIDEYPTGDDDDERMSFTHYVNRKLELMIEQPSGWRDKVRKLDMKYQERRNDIDAYPTGDDDA